jgi:hypothetical protein
MRSPRYALALTVGGLYFFTVFGGWSMFDGTPSSQIDTDLNPIAPLTKYLAPILLAILTAVWWLWGKAAKGGIALSPAEAGFLVPAPIARRRLIEFKLLMSQPAVLGSALMFSIFLRYSVLPFYVRFPSLWVLFSILNLHQTGATLVHASLQENGRSSWRRVWPAVLIFCAIFGAVTIAIARTVAAMRAAENGPQITAALDAIFNSPLTSIALLPFNAVLAPLNASGAAAAVVPFVITLLILVAHYFWVVRMDAAFEETAVDAGAKRAAAVEAMRSGKRVHLGQSKTQRIRKPWFPLGADGTPAYAIWWKNVLVFSRSFSPITIFVILALPAAVALITRSDTSSMGKSIFAGGMVLSLLGAVIVVIGPFFAVHLDLRADLQRIELLRTLPVGGARLVIAELGAAASVLGAAAFALIGFGGIIMLASGRVEHTALVLLLAVPVALFLLAYTGIQLVIQNGFALMFPAWSRGLAGQSPGIETMGMNMIMMIGSLFILLLSLVPALIVAGVAAASMYPQWGRLAAIPAGLAFLMGLFAELFLAVIWLGRLYDNIDPVEAGLCQ